MTRSRWWMVGGAVVALLVLLAGWFFLVSPTREQAAQLNTQAADLEQQNALLRSRIQQLKAQASALPEKQAQLDVISQQAPPTPDLPELVRQLSALADQTGVNLVSLTPAPPAPLVVPTPTATPTATATPTGTETATAAAAAGAPPAENIQEIGLTLTATGSFANLQLFIGRLETLERLVLTTAFTINRDAAAELAGANPLSLSLTGKVFMLPGLPTVLPTPTPTAGDLSPAPTVSGGTSGAPLPSGS